MSEGRRVGLRLAQGLIRVAVRIAPVSCRAEWEEVWRGDMEGWRNRRARRRSPVGFALGALSYATWMRFRDWTTDALGQDLRGGVRFLIRRPVVAAVTVLTLAVGIGASAAVFGMINAVVWRALPYQDADRLFTLFELDGSGAAFRLASYPTFVDWREGQDAFEPMAYVRGTTLTYRTDDATGILLAAFVSEDFFPMMGVPAAAGRGLAQDDHESGARVAVMSHRAWRSIFGGDPDIVGRTVRTSGAPFTVVGIMPEDFTYPSWGVVGTDLWLPLDALPPADRSALAQRDFHADSRIIARRRADVTPAVAQNRMDDVAARLAEEYPASSRFTRVSVQSVQDFEIRNVRARLYLLGGAVAVVLLIGCVNLANLYLAQGVARRREFAIRRALGAARWRVRRQLLTECLVVSAAGGVVGTVLAAVTLRVVRARNLETFPRAAELGLDGWVVTFTAAAVFVAAGVFALAGARWGTPASPADALGNSKGPGRLPSGMLSLQLGLTAMLLIGAALLGQSFLRLSRVDVGFEPGGLLRLHVNPPSPDYDDAAAVVALYRRVTEQVGAVPGVTEVALVNHTPLGSGGAPSRAALGRAPDGSDQDALVFLRTVSADYFSTMRIPVLAGRAFDGSDVTGPPGPIVVNEALARRLRSSPSDLVGRRVGVLKSARTRSDFGQPLVGNVVGVTGNVTYFALDAAPVLEVYLPYTHNPWPEITVVARASGDPDALLEAVERAVRDVEPGIPVGGARTRAGTMRELKVGLSAETRFNATLVGAFAVVALGLAAIGVYGVTAYSVTLETKEIGIRLALGAAPGKVRWGVVTRVVRVAGIGLLFGLPGAFAANRLIAGSLYQVQPTDPTTFATVAAILVLVAVAAGFSPARRAASVDPMTSLRIE